MRVAVSQFATCANVQENLASCLRMINQAAGCKPQLIVLPEYCNTLFSATHSGYEDHNQAWDAALALNGDFLQHIAQLAKNHQCYIVINVTLRRDKSRDLLSHQQSGLIKSNISVTSCLFSPHGKLIQQTDKKSLSGSEDEFFTTRAGVSEVINTPLGNLGLLMGDESMSFAVPRYLGLAGVQLACNSINTFALDQCRHHDANRAYENNIFFVTANKVGALISQESNSAHQADLTCSEPVDKDGFQLNIVSKKIAIGQSQIVAPNGRVLAKMSTDEEGFIFADIDLTGTGSNHTTQATSVKDAHTQRLLEVGFAYGTRPDGTKISNQLRPELYQKLTLLVKDKAKNKQLPSNNFQVPSTTNVAIFATYTENMKAIEDVCHYIENNLSDIIQLPELFFVTDKSITHSSEKLALVSSLSEVFIKQVSRVLRPFQYVCTSLVIAGNHEAVLINAQGLFSKQPQLHFCQRYQWTALGETLTIIELPLEQGCVRVAMLTGDDPNIPEIVNVAALNDLHLLLVPFDIQESGEVDYSLLSRAVEHRICIVAASREKNFADNYVNNFDNDTQAQGKKNIFSKNKRKLKKSTGVIVNLTTDPALLPQWKVQPFNGYVNQPLVKYQYGKITKAVIHPIAAKINGVIAVLNK